MFRVRSDFSETLEVRANLDRVRGFFSDIGNFIRYMPSIESIHTDSKGIAHWSIRAEVPLVGSFTEKFLVRETENNDERVEWSPAEVESQNFMRYAADFLPRSSAITLVQFSQNIELRRRSASDLHVLAGLVGETLIGNEMSRRIGDMMSIFLEEARSQLES